MYSRSLSMSNLFLRHEFAQPVKVSDQRTFQAGVHIAYAIHRLNHLVDYGEGFYWGHFWCANAKTRLKAGFGEFQSERCLRGKLGVCISALPLWSALSRASVQRFSSDTEQLYYAFSLFTTGCMKLFSSRNKAFTFAPVAATALTRHVTAQSNFL